MKVEFDIRSIISLLLRQYRLIASVIFLFAVLAGTLSFLVTPKFASTALVLIDGSGRSLIDPEAKIVDSGSENVRVMTDIEIIASDATLVDVIERKQLIGDSEFGAAAGTFNWLKSQVGFGVEIGKDPESDLLETLKRFRKAVTVERRGMTNLVSITVASRQAARAAELANAIVASHVDQQVRAKSDSARAALAIIDRQIGEVNGAIVASERQFDDFINANLERLDKQAGTGNLARLRQEIEDLKAAARDNANRRQAAADSLAAGNLDQVVTTLADTRLNDLDTQRKALGDKIANLPSDAPEAFDLKGSIAAIEDDMRREASSRIDQLQQSVADTQTRTDRIRQDLRDTVIRSDLPPEMLTEIYAIQQTAEAARRQYQGLVERRQALQSQTELQLADTRMVSPALAATEPYFPRRLLLVGLAAAFGLIAGIGLAVLRDHFVGGFLDEDQLKDVLQVELVTTIARQAGTGEDAASSLADTVVKARFSSFTEGIRKIRALINQQRRTVPAGGEDAMATVIAVTSANPSEGKTTLALSLARTLAAAGRKTLLVDCDLRRPMLATALSVEPELGLESFLSGSAGPASWASISNEDPMTPLVTVLARQNFDVATDELFLDARFSRLLSTGRRHFEYIILDTPPVEPVVDTLYIVPHADIVLFVTRWASTRQSVARKAVNWLRGAAPGVPLIAVLNDRDVVEDATSASYSRYYA